MKGGSIFLVILGLTISLIGAVFVYLMGSSYLRAMEQRNWPRAEAVILVSEVEEWRHDQFSPREYRMKLLYGYEWKGEPKTSDQFSVRGNPSYNKRPKIEKMVEDFPEGSVVKIYVNPDNPEITILKPDSKAAGYSIWFPMLFVVGGIGMALRAVFKRKA